jgi:sugar phosphate permease
MHIIFWLIGSLFYLCQYILRVSPSAITNDLMRDFSITASDVGTLISISSLSYVFMQTPAGILVDNYGVRRFMSASAMLCAVGTIIFALSESFWIASIGRIGIGVGSAFAFVSAAKIVSLWFPQKVMPVFISFTILIGSFGGVLGGKPLAFLIQSSLGWRGTLIVIACLSAIVSLLAFFVIKDKKGSFGSAVSGSKSASMLDGIKFAIKSREIFAVAMFGFGIYMPLCVFPDSWGGPFLSATYNLTREESSSLISFLYIGVMCGCPIYGWIGSKFGIYKQMCMFMTSSLILLFYFIIWHEVPVYLLKPMMGLIGVIISGQLIMFPAASIHAPININGAVVGFVNMTTMLSGACFQKVVGYVLDYFWDGQRVSETNIPIYQPAQYKTALLVIPIMLGIGFIASLFIKNKKVDL